MSENPQLLHTVFYGDEEKPLIILLHGLMGSARTWNHLVELLSPDYRIMAIDLLGFGDSPKPRVSYHLDDHLDSLRHTIERYEAKKPHMLVGFSLGSVLSIYLLRKNIIKPERLLLVAPPIYATKGEMKRRIKRSPTPALFRRGPVAAATHNVRHRAPAVARLVARITHPAVPRIVVDDASKAPFYAYLKTRHNVLERASVVHELPYVKRAAIVVGTDDQYADIAHLSKLIRRRGDIRVIPHKGHSLPFVAVEDLDRAVRDLSQSPSIPRLKTLKPNVIKNEL